MNFVNLTRHSITIGDKVLPPSGSQVRVSGRHLYIDTVDGVPLFEHTRELSMELPPKEDTIYIVSSITRHAMPDRMDIASPRLVYDKDGNILYCEGLTLNKGAKAALKKRRW